MKRTDKTDGYYYNLVVHDHNGTLEKYIYKYPLDKTEDVSISKIGDNNLNSKNKSVSAKTFGDCITTHVYNVTPCPCVGHIDPLICLCPIRPKWVYSHSKQVCTNSNPTNPTIEEPDNDNDPDIGNGVTTSDQLGCIRNSQGMSECPPPDEDPDAIIPYTPLPTLEPDFGDKDDSILTEQLDLTNLQKDWLNKLENINFKSDIEDFLIQFVFTDQFNDAKSFAQQAVIAWMLNRNTVIDFDLKTIIEINETIEFQSKVCLKSIKDDVIKTKQISKIIKKFEPTHPVLHLEWGIFGNTNWGNTGQTSLNEEQNTAFININRESLSHVSNIVMVKTIAHEIIHAELYRKLKELVDDYTIISLEEYIALQDNYLGIADYTFRYGELEYSQNISGKLVTWGLTANFSEAHHNQMADFYRGTLIEVMKAYDSSKNITRTNATEFYEALSWWSCNKKSDKFLKTYATYLN